METMEPRDTRRPVEILQVEDNLGDVRLFREAVARWRRPCRLSVVRDGDEAMAFLLRQGPHAAAPRPDLVVLDLNLPRRDGRSVLAEMKSHPDLAAIPVVVLTSSSARRDVLESYRERANCYIVKPPEADDYLEVVKKIEDFWLGVATLPT